MTDKTKTALAAEMRDTIASIDARMRALEEAFGLPSPAPAKRQTMAAISARMKALEEKAHGQGDAR